MIVFPNAKINIGLNITAKRPDGYHNIETVFYPVKINDALEAIIAPLLSFSSSGINIPGEPEKNLCIKAYELVSKDHPLPPLEIYLHKHIPIGAGLGGGSADAAFFIKLLNQQFGLNLTVQAMQDYARRLGADCAFFIENKPVYAFDKGDQFEEVSLDLSRYHIALVMPNVHVSTADAYSGVKPEPSGQSLKELVQLPVSDWKGKIKNDFEPSVFAKYPQIGAVKQALYEAGALYASMSGSGASVFGIFEAPPQLKHLEAEHQVFYDL
ncbi:4-(cytidine 5'-diphospho)-2-C-methyl-D-erythritol kinase [Mucilaginibacter sp. RS28]|uniref:4-diphosphocytidyl-2-C-methyl-D-erythritol kinase n=1 Tax=Mucilaginibacter straminoryzae TaxID=2932774 RepID=A0A9X2B9P6_9SPHI|nr:4-(cytidine 5'-diphospho)-2-C-methyl-D-erythritol kinase [Mucilaginibacter straminoryzae]MCJ8209970.1 4-(cytidine 5'-diphospho)-2-C-methyl-D-erythritol kinase [Mucilaginibacter straminoryzae]